MNRTRQDAWTKDEDILLAETVLRYIRKGETQLEAFKKVAKELSRTSAACGFRWNANIRKKYDHAISLAKKHRKHKNEENEKVVKSEGITDKADPIDTAILLLEKMKFRHQEEVSKQEDMFQIEELNKENIQLRERMRRYEEAWKEIGKLWQWIKEKDE